MVNKSQKCIIAGVCVFVYVTRGVWVLVCEWVKI